jgi:hypothetical protein
MNTYQLHNQDWNLHLTACIPLSTSEVQWEYCLMWQLSLGQTGNQTDPKQGTHILILKRITKQQFMYPPTKLVPSAKYKPGKYNYHNVGHYPLSSLLFKTRHLRDWILSPTSGGIYLDGPNRKT